MWRAYICDTCTGLIRGELDLPAYSWSMSVSDCSLTAEADKGTGEGETSGVTIPWGAIPSKASSDLATEVATGRRAICLIWEGDDGTQTPILWGAIGERTDTYFDTSFALESPLTILGKRYCIPDGMFDVSSSTTDIGDPVYRLYNSYNGEHLYTIDENEYTTLVEAGWDDEGVEWYSATSGDEVYRFYNEELADHLWTADATEIASLEANSSWESEGFAFYGGTDDDAVAIYRIYNPYDYKHMLTSSYTEFEYLVSIGWYDETTDEGYNFKGSAYTGIISDATAQQSYSGSWRGIAAQIGEACTEDKAYGDLPIDWQYADEDGDNTLELDVYDILHLSCANLLDEIANHDGGPDMAFRPYFSDSTHIRLKFIAGSDEDVYLGQDEINYLSQYNDLSVAHANPYMRIYATGTEADEETVAYMAEDLTLCIDDDDPVPLFEMQYMDESCNTVQSLKSYADAMISAYKVPMAQVSLKAKLEDLPIGELWPGEIIRVPIDDFPTLPSGNYDLRLMSMSGDQGDYATLVFDVMEDPTY